MIVDEQIDINIMDMYKKLGIVIEEYDEIPFDALDILKKYIFFNSNENTNILIHIFAYNYIYFSEIDETNAATLEDTTLEDLINDTKNYPNYLNRLLLTYLKILYNPNLYELVTFNLDLADNLTNMQNNLNKTELITDKLRNYLCELFYVYSSFNEINVNDILLYVIETGNDPFNIYKKYFKNKNEILSYKKMIIEMLYLHTFTYLLDIKKMSYLSKDQEIILEDIKKRINSNNLYTLPNDIAYQKFMIEAFFCSSEMRNAKNEAIKSIKKQTRNRVYSLLLSSIED